MKTYTSFTLMTSKDGYYKIRANYKAGKGKYKSDRFSVKDEFGKNLKNDNKKVTKRIAEEYLVKFQAKYIEDKKVESSTLDEKNFVEVFYQVADKHFVNSVVLFLETFIEKDIKSKLCRDILDYEYLWQIRDAWYELALKALNKEDFYPTYYTKKRKWKYDTHKQYFTNFLTSIKNITKRSEKYANKVNITNIDKFKEPFQRRGAIYLSDEEIKFVKSLPRYKDVVHGYPYNKKGTEAEDYQYKEAYLFCLHTGFRQTDLSRLQWKHIVSEIDGKKQLRQYVKLRASKNNNVVAVPLTKEALDIIGDRPKDNEQFLFRMFRVLNEDGTINEKLNAKKSNTRSNHLTKYLTKSKKYLKSDIDLSKLREWHNARHTFANNFLRLSKNIALTAFCLGDSIATTATYYAKYDESDMKKVAEAIDKL